MLFTSAQYSHKCTQFRDHNTERTSRQSVPPECLTKAVFEAVLLQLFPSVLYEGRRPPSDCVCLRDVPVPGHGTALSEGQGKVRSCTADKLSSHQF